MGEIEVIEALKKNGGWMTTLEVFKAGCGCNRHNAANVLRELSNRGEVLENKRKQHIGNQFKFKESESGILVNTIGSKK